MSTSVEWSCGCIETSDYPPTKCPEHQTGTVRVTAYPTRPMGHQCPLPEKRKA